MPKPRHRRRRLDTEPPPRAAWVALFILALAGLWAGMMALIVN